MKKMLRIFECALLLALLLSLSALGETAGYPAVVANPKVADRLILRATPTQDGDVLGRFYSGTPVYVVSETGTWAFVRIGSEEGTLTGYMKTEYLAKANRNHGAASLFYYSYSAGSSAALYEKKSTGSRVLSRVESNGVYVLGDIDDDWRYVYDASSGNYGYMRTAQLKAPNVDFPAWLTAAENENTVKVYADKECTTKIAEYVSTVEARVVGLSRAKGWAQVEIRGNSGEGDIFYGKFTSGYVRQENLTVFKQRWEMMYRQRVAYALSNVPITDQATGMSAVIPAGARLKVLGEMADGTLHICYGSAGFREEAMFDYVSPALLHTEMSLSAPFERIPRRGFLLMEKHVDEDGWNLGVAAYTAPEETEENLLTYLYNDMVELLAVLGNGWYQARTYSMECFYIRYADAEPLYLDSWLTPDGVQTESLYVFTAAAGERASITLKNQAWGLNQTYTITDAAYTLLIPEGTQVQQTGGTLSKTRVDGLQPLVPQLSSPDEDETLFTGSGRFFSDQLLGENLNYYSLIITPLNNYEESYYVLSSVNLEDGESVRFNPGEDPWDRSLGLELVPGTFLEVHNCRIQISYGNG